MMQDAYNSSPVGIAASQATSLVMKLTMKGALDYLNWQANGDSGCAVHTDKKGSDMSAQGELDINLYKQQPPPSISLKVDPGGPTDSYWLDCTGIGVNNKTSNTWQSVWTATHPGGLEIDGVSLEGSSPVLKTIDKSAQIGESTATETTSVSIGFEDDKDLQDHEVQR